MRAPYGAHSKITLPDALKVRPQISTKSGAHSRHNCRDLLLYDHLPVPKRARSASGIVDKAVDAGWKLSVSTPFAMTI